MSNKEMDDNEVVLINPATCGIYKSGGTRYRIDPVTGERTDEIDNELGKHVDLLLSGENPPGLATVNLDQMFQKRILVPRYYDMRWLDDFRHLLDSENLEAISLEELEARGILFVRGGHGSPSNDRRNGHIPYIKVSDLRSLRVNINPTNLVTQAVAERHWRGTDSGLFAWDLISPNRASSNIGEFSIMLPGEEQVVITKEVFIFRIIGGNDEGWNPFYLHWALCLKAVRQQWQRIALMQTNREDVGGRYKEILVPLPPSAEWAEEVSKPFREYFTTLAESRAKFLGSLYQSNYQYIASARAVGSISIDGAEDDVEELDDN